MNMEAGLGLNDDLLRRICRRLMEFNPGIVEIVQFGSSVYAPGLARDLDLLVFTEQKEGYGTYLDATAEICDEMGVPFNIDVVPSEVGKKLDRSLAIHVRGAFRVLHGDGRFLREATDWAVESLRSDPTFEEAKIAMKVASEYLGLALAAEDPALRDRHVREAFDALFHAARMASMAYLSTSETRWGKIRKDLPDAYREEFEEFVTELHIKYFYLGEYPKERAEEEFEGWLGRVNGYIERLESEVRRWVSKGHRER